MENINIWRLAFILVVPAQLLSSVVGFANLFPLNIIFTASLAPSFAFESPISNRSHPFSLSITGNLFQNFCIKESLFNLRTQDYSIRFLESSDPASFPEVGICNDVSGLRFNHKRLTKNDNNKQKKMKTMQWCQDTKVTWTMEPPTGKSLVSWPKDCKENSNMGKRGVLPNRSSLGKCGDLPSLPRPPHPPVWCFFTNKKLTHNFFGGKWTIDAWNKCYTWSHLKIFIFATVISVYVCPK